MVSRVFSINTKCQIPIYRADTLICKPQLNNTHGAVKRLLHFHYTEVPMSRFSEIAQIYDHRLPQLRSPEVWEQTTTVRLCNPT